MTRKAGMEAEVAWSWRLAVVLALACSGATIAVAGPNNPPRVTPSQRDAIERAYRDLQETRDLQAMERLERGVSRSDRFDAPGRPSRSRR
jgi:hypothetical protein